MPSPASARRPRRIAATLAAVLALAMPAGNAFAACAQADLESRWQVYGMFVDDVGAEWFRCRLTINATGIISQSLSNCTISDGSTTAVSGSLKVTNTTTCTVTGNLKPSGQPTVTVKHATLSKDKLSIGGVTESTESIGVFNGTKI